MTQAVDTRIAGQLFEIAERLADARADEPPVRDPERPRPMPNAARRAARVWSDPSEWAAEEP